MFFIPTTPNARTSLLKFLGKCKEDCGTIDKALLKKINMCDYEVVLIGKDQLNLVLAGGTAVDIQILRTLSDAWAKIDGYGPNNLDDDYLWNAIIQISKGVPMFKDSHSRILWEFNLYRERNIYFILLTGKEPLGLPVFELSMLSNIWRLDQGYLPVHASGVLHKGSLFLFGGPSGAGKSTIALMSQQRGDSILDEDQVLIHLNSDSVYTADGWGYDVVANIKPLRGVFRIVKDTKDQLLPMKQLQTAQFILERNNESSGGGLYEYLLQDFRLSSSIARTIPAYELHFRKSPDFWKLIDEQFPD